MKYIAKFPDYEIIFNSHFHYQHRAPHHHRRNDIWRGYICVLIWVNKLCHIKLKYCVALAIFLLSAARMNELMLDVCGGERGEKRARIKHFWWESNGKISQRIEHEQQIKLYSQVLTNTAYTQALKPILVPFHRHIAKQQKYTHGESQKNVLGREISREQYQSNLFGWFQLHICIAQLARSRELIYDLITHSSHTRRRSLSHALNNTNIFPVRNFKHAISCLTAVKRRKVAQQRRSWHIARRFALLVLHIGIRALLDQQLHQLEIARRSCIVQWRNVIQAWRAHIGAVLDEHQGKIVISMIAGFVQWSPAFKLKQMLWISLRISKN